MLGTGTTSHRPAGSPYGVEQLGDVRIHGHVAPQREDAGELRPGMLHRHSPRWSFWIAGIDQPRSVAIEDRKDLVEHVAHHLLEVIRALNRPVDRIHALEEPEMGGEFARRARAL